MLTDAPVLRQVAVQVPANPDVTQLEGSCEAATHSQGRGLVHRQGCFFNRESVCVAGLSEFDLTQYEN
jgi:hypothetical protein